MSNQISKAPIRDWDREYSERTAAWDTGRVSTQLRDLVESGVPTILPGSRALELGCGAGTNAIFLSQSGYRTTAIDLSEEALELARLRAARAGVEIEWALANFLEPETNLPLRIPYDFAFDRGCFHVIAPEDRPRFVEQLRLAIRPSAYYFMLCGNAREPQAGGPPVVSEKEIHETFGEFFVIERIKEFRLDTSNSRPGALAWACLLTRKL